MRATLKIIIVAASILLFSATAAANEASNSNAIPAQTAQTEQTVPVRHVIMGDVVAPKRKIRIVREALPGHNTATRVNTQGRFVIATDKSRDAMIVYKSVKPGKNIPNLFKN